ncbi:unnamed protein product [Prunus armeniaca]|uniref:Uncharacterized protein n=1 Tax=Prunus armeniaca TaxID=36596 RepID=A0A6J5UKT0_PRUAR|nr:unnamed protein product [Prunus armeniaca]
MQGDRDTLDNTHHQPATQNHHKATPVDTTSSSQYFDSTQIEDVGPPTGKLSGTALEWRRRQPSLDPCLKSCKQRQGEVSNEL